VRSAKVRVSGDTFEGGGSGQDDGEDDKGRDVEGCGFGGSDLG